MTQGVYLCVEIPMNLPVIKLSDDESTIQGCGHTG